MKPQADCMLVLMGATAECKKELTGFQTGMRESGLGVVSPMSLEMGSQHRPNRVAFY